MRTNWAWALLTGSLAMVGCQERSASDAQAEKLFAWSAQNPFVSENTWKGVAKLVCRPARLEVCGPEGCKQQKPKAWIEIVDPNAPMLRRCTASGCDQTTAEVNYSGAFANINIRGNASFVRITANGEYLETASLMDTVLIYRGHCEAQ